MLRYQNYRHKKILTGPSITLIYRPIGFQYLTIDISYARCTISDDSLMGLKLLILTVSVIRNLSIKK